MSTQINTARALICVHLCRNVLTTVPCAAGLQIAVFDMYLGNISAR